MKIRKLSRKPIRVKQNAWNYEKPTHQSISINIIIVYIVLSVYFFGLRDLLMFHIGLFYSSLFYFDYLVVCFGISHPYTFIRIIIIIKFHYKLIIQRIKQLFNKFWIECGRKRQSNGFYHINCAPKSKWHTFIYVNKAAILYLFVLSPWECTFGIYYWVSCKMYTASVQLIF